MATLPTITGASPINASNNTYLTHTADIDLDIQTSALGDTPSDFSTMSSGLQWSCEYSLSAARTDDTYGLQVRIMDSGGTTVLAGASSTAASAWVTVSANITSTTDTTTSLSAFAYVNTTADKATWDGAIIEFRQNYSKTKGADGCAVRIDYFRIAGNYATGAQNLNASLFSNSQTFFAPTVSATYNLTPALFTNSQTFYASTVTSSQNLDASLVVNSQSFFTPTVSASYDLSATFFANSQSFPSPTVVAGAVALSFSLFTNNQTFFSPSVSLGASQDIDFSLFINTQSFFAPSVAASNNLEVLLLNEGQTFFSPTILATTDITASLFTNSQSFFVPSVSASNTLSVPLIPSGNQFFAAALDGGVVSAIAEYSGAMARLSHNGDLIVQIRAARTHG